MKKLILIGLGLLGLVVVGAVIYVILNINPLVKHAVNTFGPKITGTDVSVEDVSLSVFSGQGTMSGLVIGNPDGFQEKTLMSLGRIEVGVDLGTVTSEQIVINEVVLVAPHVTYEQTGKSPSNFEVLMDNIKQSTAAEAPPAGTPGETPAETGQEPGQKPGKTMLIKDFWFTDGKATVAVTGLAGESLTVDLPTIHLTDVGGDTPPDVVMEQIMDAIYAAVQQSILDMGVAVFENGRLVAEETLGFVVDTVTDPVGTVEAVGEGAGEVLEDVGQGVEDVGKSLFQ